MLKVDLRIHGPREFETTATDIAIKPGDLRPFPGANGSACRMNGEPKQPVGS